MKKIVTIITIILSLIFIFNVYAKKESKKINASLNEIFAISPIKIGTGYWQITSYDKSYLKLKEDIKDPIPKFIFQAKKVGTTKVLLENKRLAKKMAYKIYIFPKSTPKQKKTNNDFEINIKSKERKNEFPNTAKRKNQNIRKYTKPDREIMKNADVFYQFIIGLYQRRLYQRVLSQIDQFRKLFPDHFKMNELAMLKGKTLTQLKRYNKAIQWYKSIIEEDVELAKTGQILLLLGKLYEKKRDVNNAKVCYIKILTLLHDPKMLSEAHFSLGKIYFSLKQYHKGIIELESLIQKFPEAIQKREIALYLLGEMYYKKSVLRNYKKAYQYFRILTEEFPRRYYSRKARKKMKFLEQNFIKYY